ncbi:MAG: hypothetical protein IKJ41_00800 [Clostridia bacterium]|nr:hypothetical protein [Clostridia bacterium]
MKYSKNATYDYETNGISVENGYTKWYDKEIIGKKLRLAGTYSQAFMVAVLIGVSRVFAEDIKAFGIPKIILLLALNAIILMLIIAPMREFLHLIPVSKGRLDRKCIISFRNHFSVYNGSVNRSQILISLALPLIVFIPVFGLFSFLTSGIVRLCAVFLLIDSCFMCHSDIYMLFFCIKNIGKNDTVFGEYKKAKK